MNAREVLRARSKSFALAARLLPPGVADDAAVVYAFCRHADDAIDEGADPAAGLARLRLEVDQVYSPDARGEFAEVVQRRRIPRAYVDELLAGMAMDVAGARYQTLDELLVYCHRVAGTVGLMMCHVMGVRDPRALRRAAHLGLAMQLTNICRDVHEDWRLGRLYLPRTLLGKSAPEVASGPFPEALRERARLATQALLGEAERYYASADEGLRFLGFRCALAVRTARYVYAAIGRRVEAQRCDPLAGRAVVPLWRKLLLAARALVQTWPVLAGKPTLPQAVLRFPDDVLPL